uniref:flagellar motor switch protein FliN n=1 Tax=Treponema saccharophilum TaxID=165 RepID=UPI0038681007
NGTSGKNFEISSVAVESMTRDPMLSKLTDDVVSVYADFNAGLTGEHSFFISPEFAQKIAGADSYSDDVGAMIQEIMGNIAGAEITDIGSKVAGLASDPPNVNNGLKATVRMPEGVFALVTYVLTIDGGTYELYEVISSNVASGLASALGGGEPKNSAPAANAQQPMMGGMNPMGGMQQPMMGMNPMAGMQQPMMGMNPMGGMQQPMMGMNPMAGMQQPMMGGMGQMGITPPNVQSVQYPNLQGNMGTGEQGNIGLIMDVFMEMTVELGRTKKQIREILGMGEGTIIELDKLAGEPVDILVNHKPIAKGEVVVIDENFGVRVTEILSPMERVSDVH